MLRSAQRLVLFAVPTWLVAGAALAQTTYAVAVQGPADLDEATRNGVELQLRSAASAAGFALVDGSLVRQAASRVVIGRIDGEDNLRALGKAVRAKKVLVAVLEREGTAQWKVRITVFDVTEEERKQGERVLPVAQTAALSRGLADEVIAGRATPPPPAVVPQPGIPTPVAPPPVTPGDLGIAPPPVNPPPAVPPPVGATPPGATPPPPGTTPPATTPPPSGAVVGTYKGFFINGGMAFGVYQIFNWMLVVQPGYSWDRISVALRLGAHAAGTGDDKFGAVGNFLFGLEGRYYLAEGNWKPYPVVSMNGLLGSNSFFQFSLGFGLQYDWSKNLSFYGELSPLGLFAGGDPVGGNYHFSFGGGVQYRF